MRHLRRGRRLGTDASHHKAMMASLASQILEHERIRTTLTRAKEVRSTVDHLITLGKRGDVHARRQALSVMGDRALVHKVFTDVAEKYRERPGGYTRIIKLGPRQGDAAPMAFIELV